MICASFSLRWRLGTSTVRCDGLASRPSRPFQTRASTRALCSKTSTCSEQSCCRWFAARRASIRSAWRLSGFSVSACMYVCTCDGALLLVPARRHVSAYVVCSMAFAAWHMFVRCHVVHGAGFNNRARSMGLAVDSSPVCAWQACIAIHSRACMSYACMHAFRMYACAHKHSLRHLRAHAHPRRCS